MSDVSSWHMFSEISRCVEAPEKAEIRLTAGHFRPFVPPYLSLRSDCLHSLKTWSWPTYLVYYLRLSGLLSEHVEGTKLAFFAGLRGPHLFPVVALGPSVVQDSIEGGESRPRQCYLSMAYFSKTFNPTSKTNKYLLDGPWRA